MEREQSMALDGEDSLNPFFVQATQFDMTDAEAASELERMMSMGPSYQQATQPSEAFMSLATRTDLQRRLQLHHLQRMQHPVALELSRQQPLYHAHGQDLCGAHQRYYASITVPRAVPSPSARIYLETRSPAELPPSFHYRT